MDLSDEARRHFAENAEVISGSLVYLDEGSPPALILNTAFLYVDLSQ